MLELKTRVRRGWIAAALFSLVAAIYFFPQQRSVMDSNYSMLLSEQLGRNFSFRLDAFFPQIDRSKSEGATGKTVPYGVYLHRKHVYYFYPPGSSVLSVPLVLAMNAAGVSARRPDGQPNLAGEEQIQRVGASLVTAGTVALLFLVAARLLDTRRALVLALVAAFATSLWSSSSRVLWTHTWAGFLLSAALLLIVRAEQGERLRPVLLASLLAWLYFTRPTFSVTIIAVTVFVFVRRRADFLPYAITGAVWLLLFVKHSLKTSGQLLPPYYASGAMFSPGDFTEALTGSLFSPGRGLLVYSPVVLVAVWLAWRGGAWRMERPLVLLAGGAALLHTIVLGLWPIWWGGYCYGPRLAVDMIPWLALLAALGWRSRLTVDARSNPARLCVVLLLATSILMQANGVFRVETWIWNARPEDVDRAPHRLWDWSDPPFLRR